MKKPGISALADKVMAKRRPRADDDEGEDYAKGGAAAMGELMAAIKGGDKAAAFDAFKQAVKLCGG